MTDRIEIRITGLGGQGVVLAGQILGLAAVYDGKNVVQTQSYGAEARGSAAKCEVIISDKKIGFPTVRKCDILVAMSQIALDQHIHDLKKSATLMVDKDLVKQIPKVESQVHKLPTTEIAEVELKSKIYANVIMLGALAKTTSIVSKESMEKAIERIVRAETLKTNLSAFEKGLSL